MLTGAKLAIGLAASLMETDRAQIVYEVRSQRRREYEDIKAEAKARREQSERERVEREAPIIAAAEAKRERRRLRNLRVNNSI